MLEIALAGLIMFGILLGIVYWIENRKKKTH